MKAETQLTDPVFPSRVLDFPAPDQVRDKLRRESSRAIHRPHINIMDLFTDYTGKVKEDYRG